MKVLTASILVTMTIPTFLTARIPTPGYHVIYGNRDGSSIIVGPDMEIEIEMWVATPLNGDLDHNGVVDSITIMHNPLASNDSVITSRDGGSIFFPINQWYDVSFYPPNPDTIPGFTNQSLFCFSNFPDYRLNTAGDTIHIASFEMRTADDPDYYYELVCPLIEGYSTSVTGWHGHLWWMQDGLTEIYPDQTYSCLYFVDFYAGDANGSGEVNGLDLIYLVSYFKGNGPAPDPVFAGDANGDCLTNGLDVIYLLNFFKGIGPSPLYGECY